MVDGLDLDALSRFLAPWTGRRLVTLQAELITGGKSNLTYRVSDGTQRWVVRRPPLGHVLSTAHDMAREYHVMDALAPTSVPVPAMVALCEDPNVMGTPFYVMEAVEGEVLRSSADMVGLTPCARADIAHQLIDTLADLHQLDPPSIGLGEFGHPASFLERQVRRWTAQLAQSRSRDIPGFDELAADLARTLPVTQRSAIVHGDYRLDNMIIGQGSTGPTIRAVLDWEMATLGDPLCDLGLIPVYAEPVPGIVGIVSDGMGPHNGFPPLHTLFDQYADRSGLDVSGLAWYIALGYYKLAVICEGIYYRYAAGQTVGGGFDHIGEIVAPLVTAGREALT